MRTIKFRAKSGCRGETWLYGYIRHYGHNPHTEKWTIYDPETRIETDVYPDTIGQFTGLYDKNGNEIYEGDIVKDIDDELQQVRWLWSGWGLQRLSDGEKWGWCIVPGYDKEREYVEVIVNIHDNPEMMKGGEQ